MAAVEATGLVPLLIALIGGGGLVAGLVALLKIKPEKASMAVEQAQGAMEVMHSLQVSLEGELARNRERLEACRNERLRLEDELRECRQMLRHLASDTEH